MRKITLLLLFFALLAACDPVYEVGLSAVSIEPDDETVSLALAGYAAPAQGRFSLTWEDKGRVGDTSCLSGIKQLLKEAATVWPDKDIISETGDAYRSYAVTSGNYLLQRDLHATGRWQRIGYDNGETYAIDILKIIRWKNKLYALASDGHVYMSRHSTEANLSSSAVAFKKGNATVVLVGVDVCGLDYSFTCRIRKEITKRRGIPEEAILINSSHTHFAPVTQQWLVWGTTNRYPDSLYLNRIVYPGIIRSIENALDNMEPARVFFGRDTTAIGYNRSLKGDLAVYDNSVDVLRIEPVGNKPPSLLFLAGCHPVSTGSLAGKYTLSANFPGYARELLRKEGYEHVVFLQACCGDINPKHSAEITGSRLANDVQRCLKKEMARIKGPIRMKADSVDIPVDPLSVEAIQALRNEYADQVGHPPGGDENDIPGRNVRWADRMLSYYATGTMPATMPVYIQTFDIGDWRLAGLSREATTAYGLAIKALWPERKVSVIAYVNDVSSYLATDPHIRAKDYEGYESFFWYGQPSPFPLGTFDVVIRYFREKD